MSLASYYKRKAIHSIIAQDIDVDVNTYHAWADIWYVAHTMNGVISDKPLIFNPTTNLSNARLDEETASALLNIAICNHVYLTRILLCDLPCELMIHKPHFQVMKLPGVTLCKHCEHKLDHHRTNLGPLVFRDEIKASYEQAYPGCTLDDRGLIVLKP